ncbi:DUF1254 domain-containing protein [Phenylobacterium sp. LjRoot164]|uniref:DUF1254 domain-containing protein n=1 Tax=unclassified Phenylobacterium TaxID=2640670 RepID=UPI003ECE1C61
MPQAVPVTVENFTRAETDMYFAHSAAEGGFGKFHHHREPMRIDAQSVVRANRDTLYSSGVFDLDAGPVTVTMPDAGPRFMSLQVFDEDEYVIEVAYGPGAHTYTRDAVGSRYMMVGVRTLLNPDDPADLKAVHALQDAITAQQKSPGLFETPSWDPVSQKTVRDALIVLAGTLPDTRRMFGAKSDVDPLRHLIGAATGWGGNPEKDALYLTVTPPKNDGQTVHRLTVKDVPVDGFWSISVYNADGYFEKNDRNAYSLNNLTAKKNADGSVTVQFGGCADDVANCLPITPGWNYWVRLYRPRAEVLDGGWTFPDPQPV